MGAFFYAGNQHQDPTATVTLRSRSLGSPKEATPLASPFEPESESAWSAFWWARRRRGCPLPCKQESNSITLLNSEEV